MELIDCSLRVYRRPAPTRQRTHQQYQLTSALSLGGVSYFGIGRDLVATTTCIQLNSRFTLNLNGKISFFFVFTAATRLSDLPPEAPFTSKSGLFGTSMTLVFLDYPLDGAQHVRRKCSIFNDGRADKEIVDGVSMIASRELAISLHSG